MKKVDPKLQRLGDLNEIIAFRPWSLELPSIIETLANGDLSWSIPEILQAGAIMA
jgi:hypothetical protein